MFLNWIMLAGIAGAGVPLLLHLLARARYESRDWGAMLFLAGNLPRQQQSAKLRQTLLLLFRMLLVALLAIALARPIAGAKVGVRGQVAAAIVLDGSATMEYEQNGISRLELARSMAARILAQLGRGDQAALVVSGGADGGQPAMTDDLQAVATDLAQVRAGGDSPPLAQALHRAKGLLDQSAAAGRELYILTDRVAQKWSETLPTDAAAPAAKPAWSAYHPVWIAVGTEQMDTAAIQSVKLLNPPAIAGQPMEIEVSLRNDAPQAQGPLTLTISQDQHALSTSHVSLVPRGTAIARASVTLNQPGAALLPVTLDAAAVAQENQANLAVDVLSPLRVRLISGDERMDGFGKESAFFHLALCPRQMNGLEGGDMANLTIVPVEKFNPFDLGDTQVLVLANVPKLSAAQSRAGELFVLGGGGLLVAPGNLTQAKALNAQLERQGAGMLPAALQEPTPPDISKATSVLGIELNHPLFAFASGLSDPLPVATIGRYFPLTGLHADARVLATLGSGTPLLVEGTWGKGRVLLLSTPLDADWNALPLSGFYLPFVQSMVRYLAVPSEESRNPIIGQPLLLIVHGPLDQNRATITLPDGRQRGIASLGGPNLWQLHWSNTSEPGVYRFNYRQNGNEQSIPFAVQRRPTPTARAMLTDEEMTKIAEQLGLKLLSRQPADLAGVVGKTRGGNELWEWGLLSVIALGLAELLLAQKWGSGV